MGSESTDIREFAETVARSAGASLGHTAADWRTLAAASRHTIPWAEEMGRCYCEALYANVVEKGGSVVNLGDEVQAFAVWYERLVSGAPGESFWAETCLTGFVHASADIDNGRVLAALGKVSDLFLRKLFATLPSDETLLVFSAFRRVLDVAAAVLVDSYVSALIRGVSQIGLNDRLLKRMRSVAIRKMVDEGRDSIPMMTWDDALSVGVKAIDEQHMRLIELLNELHRAHSAGKGNEVLRGVLRELVEYTETHFTFEEELFREHGYPGASDHEQAHAALKSQVIGFASSFEAGKVRLSGDLFLFLRNWLNGHIRGTDRRYAPFFRERGVR